jgi:RND family efflux transporter MFP subunit
MSRYRFPTLLYAILLLVPAISGCHSGESGKQERELPAVTAANPLEWTVVDHEEYPVPTITGNNTVDIRSRVSGYLWKIEFESGKEVEKDQLLFVIDQRPYKADLEKAKSEVDACDARLIRTKADLVRAQELIEGKAISKEDFDRIVSDEREANAASEGAKATMQQAQNNMDYTEIRAPFGGRIGRNLIDVGNLVQADNTLLTNIVCADPIFVYFYIPEATLNKLIKERIDNKDAGGANQKLSDIPVDLQVEGESGYPHQGHLNFIDNRIKSTTGVISVRAEFPNPSRGDGVRNIVAGGHGKIRIPFSDPYKALCVPEDAVSNDQSQKIVYVVDDKDVITRRPVALGEIHDGLQVITKGLAPADRVVINGAILVRPGMKVKVEAGKIPEPPKTEETKPKEPEKTSPDKENK